MTVQALPQRLHFIGVGGVGMSAIALVLAARDHRVSGSDAEESARTHQLAEHGVRIHIGHDSENLGDAEAVVVSTAIRESNPELAEARRRGLPIIHRSEALAAIVDAAEGIAVTGTHGKTTTTGMLALALDHAGADPTALIGSDVAQFGSNARIGEGPHVVAEVDESDASLLNTHPVWAIVTNIDLDHMDHYRDEDHLVETFGLFLSQVQPEGGAVVWHDDPRLTALRAKSKCRIWTYSTTSAEADYQIRELAPTVDGSTFAVRTRGGENLADVTLHVPGEHNALNAAAVVALCHQLGLDLGRVAQALEEFRGTKRRFQRVGEAAGVTVIDDYAHHPTEIRVTLSAARAIHPEGRLIAVFQPHRFTRTKHLWREFAESLSENVDALVLTAVYGAGESPITDICTELIFDAMPADGGPERAMCPSLSGVVEHLRGLVQPGDWVITMGAGDVWRVGEMLLEKLSTESTAPV